MKRSKCLALALCLLVGSFSAQLSAQKNLEAVIQKCKSDKTVDKSIVTRKDPQTKRLEKVVSSFTIRGNNALRQEVMTAFERDKEEAYQVIQNESNGEVSWFIRFAKANVRTSYSLNVDGDDELSLTVIDTYDEEKGVDAKHGDKE